MRVIPGYAIKEIVLENHDALVLRASKGEGTVLLRLPASDYPSQDEIARFRRDHEVNQRLDIADLVRILAVEEHGRTIVQVLADFGGAPLRTLVDTRALELKAMLRIATQLTQILGELHQAGVVHRCVDPANVFVAPATNEVKLAHFTSSGLTGTGQSTPGSFERMLGTLAYISPEQTGRMHRSVDHRSDFYSLGVTLYEMLVGRLPFEDKDPMSLVHSHLAIKPEPPCVVAPSVPKAVSDIVMKLLAKNAEDRYQSAFGIAADLSACLTDLASGGTIGEIVPGQKDGSAVFQLPHRLYGREEQIAALMRAFERTRGGTKQLCLVSGYSGIGKSALVDETHTPIVRRSGHFCSGKFDQLHRVPYGALIDAFQQQIHQILRTSADEIQVWRERLTEALDTGAGALVTVVPEVELILGPQPPLGELGPSEARDLFNWVFAEFIAVFARADQPLVIFLDDLQWADSASLGLLERLLCDDRIQYLCVIGAYRSDEIDNTHPATLTFERVRKAGVAVNEISLGPLQRTDVDELVGDALGRYEPEALSELVEIVHHFTEGNPFFIGQFLTSLYDREILVFDPRQGRWHWSLSAIQSAGIPDSVASLMAARIRRLSQPTQQVLQLAACIGHNFALSTLAVISEQPRSETVSQLREAILDGFVVPVEHGRPVTSAPQGDRHPEHFGFLHDRVQEAAYALVTDETRKAKVHHRIGRLLLAGTSEKTLDAHIFDIVDQLDLSLSLIDNENERVEVAELNLRAGQRAKNSTAYKSAFEYLDVGVQLLGDDGWERAHALMFSLCRERAECAYLLDDEDAAEAAFNRVLEFSRSRAHKLEILELRAELQLGRGGFEPAIATVRDALSLYGVEIPERDQLGAAYLAEVQTIKELLSGREILSLDDTPASRDDSHHIIIRLLARLASMAYNDPALFIFLIAHLVRLSLERGHAPCTGFGYMFYGTIICEAGDFAAAHDFGVLGMRISKRLDVGSWRGMTQFLYGAFLHPWRRPPHTSVPVLEKAYAACLESGTVFWASLARMQIVFLEFLAGATLDETIERATGYARHQRRSGQRDTATGIGIYQLLALRLKHGDDSTDGQGYRDEDALLGQLDHYPSLGVLCYIPAFGVALILGDRERADELCKAAMPRLASLTGHILLVDFAFCRALLAAACHASATPEQQQEHRRVIDEEYEKLAAWAELYPENFQHKALLVAAEVARLDGRETAAMKLYDRAIESAADNGFIQWDAFAGELCAQFYLARGYKRIARAYLLDARYSYRRWGADAKVVALDQQYGELLSGPKAVADSEQQGAFALDLLSVVKASQAISGEIVLRELLHQLMRTLLENAGAQRGVLILVGEQEIFVASDGAADGGARVLDSADSIEFSQSLVRYVQRTGQTAVYGDAAKVSALASDPYVVRAQPRSVLCMPIFGQRRIVAVLYLENNLARFAFTPERCRVLELLSSQAAISIENAQLYDTLDSKVKERTRELNTRNRELSLALERVATTQKQLIEHEKLASLGALTAGVAHELRNPLNFVTNFASVSAELLSELTEGIQSQSDQLEEPVFTDLESLVTMLEENMLSIDEHGRRASNIISSMLLHAHQEPDTPSSLDFNSLVAACVKLTSTGLSPSKPNVTIQIEEDYAPDVGTIEAAGGDLRRVIINVLNNARHALIAKQAVIPVGYQPSIRVATRVVGEHLELKIRDNGTGIPPETLPKIYDPFFTTKDPGEGTGLGLYICHSIVRAHRGEIAADSEYGSFTEITIRLPRFSTPEQTATPELRPDVRPEFRPEFRPDVRSEGGERG